MGSMRWIYVLFVIKTLTCAASDLSVEFDEKDNSLDGESEEYDVNPSIPGKYEKHVYFLETFDNPEEVAKRWIKSEAKKPEASADIEQYNGKWRVEPLVNHALRGDKGLVLSTSNRHAAISAPLTKPFIFKDTPLVIQYEVAFQEKLDCGGGYLKLLTNEKHDLKKFNNLTPYSIMFGPDICGSKSKVHFILNYKNPVTGSITEKHCTMLKAPNSIFTDKQPHLFTLILRPDNTYTYLLDQEVKHEGNATVSDEFSPPILPAKEIVDESDKKPTDWDEREKIPDPNAVKPDDWDETAPATIEDPDAKKPDGWLDDESEFIPDPKAVRPEDWDTEMDGEWEPASVENPACKSAPGCGEWKPPTIPNPNYKGPWRAPMIDNPNYKGKWHPRKIPNPEYFEDNNVFRSVNIGAVGFELWSLSNGIYFDNILVASSQDCADAFADKTFETKTAKLSKETATLWGKMMKSMNYKPGWWAIYGTYCLIPVCIYVWYLWRRVVEASWLASPVNAIKDFVGDRPWMYAVFIGIIALPVVIALVFCCGKSNEKEKEDKDNVARAKKTDEALPDDVPNEEENEKEMKEEEDEIKKEEAAGESLNKSNDEDEEEELNSGNDSCDETVDSTTTGSGDAPASPRRRPRRD